MQFGGSRIVTNARYKMSESVDQSACVVYGKDTNANYPVLRLDYATLATGGTGFIVWWDGGFNSDSAKFYIVDIEMDPFAAIERAVAVCSMVVITSAAIDAIKQRGDLGRLQQMQSAAFDRDNRTIGEATKMFGVHGYVVWGYDTNLEIPGCTIDYDGRYECLYRTNTINANTRQLLVAHNDDPIALLRAARRRHSYVIITVRAMTRMQSAGHDLSSIRESTSPSEKRGVAVVREAARVLRTGVGNVSEARDTLSRYGFTETGLSEITMSRSTNNLIARIDRLCEISTGALVWAQKHREEFPESRNKIGGSKGKYKARKVGQFGAKSLVNESDAPMVKITGKTETGETFKGVLHANTRMGNWVWAYRVGQRGSDAVKVKPDTTTIARLRKLDVEAGLPGHYITDQFNYDKERGLGEADEKSEYAKHAKTLLSDSTRAAADSDSRHSTPWGLGYRTYLKTILRGDDPNGTKPKGDHLAGWNQARHDLAALDPMTEARKSAKMTSRPEHSVGAVDVPRFMQARHIDPNKVTPDEHDQALNYLKQTQSRGRLRANAAVYYQQAKILWGKGDKAGAMSQHWFGSMSAKAAGDSFIPASSLFSESTAVKEAVVPDTKYRIQGITFVVRPSQDNPQVFNVYTQRRNGLGFITTAVANNKEAVTAAITAANAKVFESLDEVAGYTLRASDKKAVDAWIQQKALDGGWVTNDGTTLSTTGMGSAVSAKWINGKPYLGPVYGNVTQTLNNYIRKALKQQGMTTIGRLDGKGNALSENVYHTIHDAAIPDLAPGTSEVWFAKPNAGPARRGALAETHVKVGSVRCNSPERLFVLMQQHKWSPGGEAAPMLESMGVRRQSLTVGDVLVVNGRHLLVSERGFVRLEN